eukprot:4451803-Prymnesium_polylepis.1
MVGCACAPRQIDVSDACLVECGTVDSLRRDGRWGWEPRGHALGSRSGRWERTRHATLPLSIGRLQSHIKDWGVLLNNGNLHDLMGTLNPKC